MVRRNRSALFAFCCSSGVRSHDLRVAVAGLAFLHIDVSGAVATITNQSASDVVLTAATLDTGGVAIGKTTPGAGITAYLATDTARTLPKRTTTARSDGYWTLAVDPGATYTLVFSEDGYSELTRTVTT